MNLSHAAALLLGLCGVAAVCGSPAPGEQKYETLSSSIDEYAMHAIWRVAADVDEIVHVVFYPKGVTSYTGGSPGLGLTPLPKGVSTFPDGLYVDAVLVPVGPGRRVFVYAKDRSMRPIELTAEESKALGPEAIRRLEPTAVWKEKIKPVLDQEEWPE